MTTTQPPRPGARTQGEGICGFAHTPPATYQHVLWIWFENRSYGSIVGSSDAPYTNSLGDRCGLATNFYGETHPSLPNYIASTAGTTAGITSDCQPSQCPVSAPSVFRQLERAGKSWKTYAESMPGNCTTYRQDQYAPKHNPAAYFTDIKATCPHRNVPLGTTTSGAMSSDLDNGTLPSFAFIAPNLCNDTHNCKVSTGDAWLKDWMTRILESKTYAAGRTAVFITWDEGPDGSHGQDCFANSDDTCHIPTYVVGPAVGPGAKSGARFSHYSMLKTTEQMLGLRAYLGRAASAPSMRAAFGL